MNLIHFISHLMDENELAGTREKTNQSDPENEENRLPRPDQANRQHCCQQQNHEIVPELLGLLRDPPGKS